MMIHGVDKVMEAQNAIILDAMVKCHDVLAHHKRAVVSISGGGDSDVMLDLVERTKDDTGCEVSYVWFDTGMEYRATKRHLSYLEDRYGMEILRYRSKKSIPVCCKEYGQPFLSKYVSENIERLQRHGFKWEDEPFDALIERYPKCRASLKWWTGSWTRTARPGWFDIGRNRFLKEFMVENPPWFSISNKCCEYTKKKVADVVNRELDVDVELIGIRRAEGGIRSVKSACVETHKEPPDTYFPLLWFSDDDKADYCRIFEIENSDCYSKWGFRRTGCVGCPFNKRVENELSVTDRFEPNMSKAARKVFSDSYEYTRMYREYVSEHKTGQMRLGMF